MRPLHKFLTLSLVNQVLVIQSVTLLVLITLGLRLLPFQIIRRLLFNLGRQSKGASQINDFSPEYLARVIRIASHFVPTANCLPQALVLQTLLKRRGYPAQLHIGVTKTEDGQLKAHAWLTSQGSILIGNLENLSQYIPLPSLEKKSA